MIVLDTTVLVYSTGADHPLRAPSRALIEAIRNGGLRATTTPEVVQEFVHVRARRQGPHGAASLGRAFAKLLSPLLQVTGENLDRGLGLFEEVEKLGAFDAVLAGAALDNGADALVSGDRAFADVPGLEHRFPDREGLAGILNPA